MSPILPAAELTSVWRIPRGDPPILAGHALSLRMERLIGTPIT
jgi:hypothetical protein